MATIADYIVEQNATAGMIIDPFMEDHPEINNHALTVISNDDIDFIVGSRVGRNTTTGYIERGGYSAFRTASFGSREFRAVPFEVRSATPWSGHRSGVVNAMHQREFDALVEDALQGVCSDFYTGGGTAAAVGSGNVNAAAPDGLEAILALQANPIVVDAGATGGGDTYRAYVVRWNQRNGLNWGFPVGDEGWHVQRNLVEHNLTNADGSTHGLLSYMSGQHCLVPADEYCVGVVQNIDADNVLTDALLNSLFRAAPSGRSFNSVFIHRDCPSTLRLLSVGLTAAETGAMPEWMRQLGVSASDDVFQESFTRTMPDDFPVV